MSDSSGDQRLARIERGLDALFATEVAKEILEAVNFEAVLADQPADDPVDVDRLAEAVGRPLGRYLAHRIVGGSGAGGVAKRAVGSEVGGRIAAKTVRVAVEQVNAESVATTLAELDETLPGPGLREVVDSDADGTVVPVEPPEGGDESGSEERDPVGGEGVDATGETGDSANGVDDEDAEAGADADDVDDE